MNENAPKSTDKSTEPNTIQKSQVNEAQKSQTTEAQTPQSTEAQKPKPITITSIKEGVKKAPSKASEAIRTGKGNSLISEVQKALAELIQAIPGSCKLLSLNQLLLTKADKEKMSQNAMLLGALSTILFIIIGLITQDTKMLFTAAVFVIAIFIANGLISRKGVSSQITTKKKKSKPKTVNKNTGSDDMLL